MLLTLFLCECNLFVCLLLTLNKKKFCGKVDINYYNLIRNSKLLFQQYLNILLEALEKQIMIFNVK